MSKETNEPAFPHHVICDNGWAETQKFQGLTLRDYFAAKALTAILYADRVSGIIGVNCYEQNRAKDAYQMADAMLEARK